MCIEETQKHDLKARRVTAFIGCNNRSYLCVYIVHAHQKANSVYMYIIIISISRGVYAVHERAVSLVRNDHTYTVGQRYQGNRGHI